MMNENCFIEPFEANSSKKLSKLINDFSSEKNDYIIKDAKYHILFRPTFSSSEGASEYKFFAFVTYVKINLSKL
jgi:hypothetical protein